MTIRQSKGGDSLKRRLSLLASLLLIDTLLPLAAAQNPDWVEHYYTQGFYALLSRLQHFLLASLPFSMAELVLLLSLIGALGLLCRWLQAYRCLDGPAAVPSWLADGLYQIAILSFAIHLTFLLSWGLNYYRPPLSATLHLTVEPANLTELQELAEDLIRQANLERSLTYENPDGIADLREDTPFYLRLPWNDTGEYRQAKAVWLSSLMSYTQITGFFFPFTGEANVNTNVPRYELPATVAHELAHQDGIAREDEANFVSWQKSRLPQAPPELRYSGTMLALVHTLNACALAMSAEEYTALWRQISPTVERDLTYSREFWNRYRGPVQGVAEQINDNYLKSNRQEDGVRSYGRMIDLLLAEYRASKPAP